MILGTDTVTRLRGRTRDNFGNLAGTDVPAPISGCSVQPLGGSEQTATGQSAETNMTLYAPAGTDLLATDRVSYDGRTYAVNGPPKNWPASTGLPHVEAELLLTEGQA